MKFQHLLILLILFPNIQVSSSSSSSSCGDLQNVVNHLPENCGGKNYQLDCEGNNTILSIYSYKFFLKDISFPNTTFRLVSPSYSAPDNPSCSLPNQTLSLKIMESYFFDPENLTIVRFLNCTEEIENWEYELIPCVNRTNSRVYVAPYLSSNIIYEVSQFPDSCRLVGSAVAFLPFVLVDGEKRWDGFNYAVFMQAIETGVLVNWTAIKMSYSVRTVSCSTFERCWIPLREILEFSKFEEKIIFLFFWAPAILNCLYLHQDPVAFSLMLIFFVLLYVVVIMLVTRIILAPLAICSFLLHKRWKIISSVSSIEKFLRKNEILCIRRYDFVEISIMTNHFKDKVGQGGFGSVYKGKLLGGQQVAVKILSNSIGDGDDFISEVATIGRIHHANIVRLIGFCSEGSKRALIYAYMPNGSLDKYIFSSSIDALPMEKRREIAIGIARGMDYLHRGCEMQILHFDIKPHNILLDNNLIPKISDFGLAKLYSRDYNLVTLSMARGTIGYIAPELISRTFGAISYKADVYSFGMLLMEMASGRKNVNNYAESSSEVYYPSWIYDKLNFSNEVYNLNQGVQKFGEIEETLYKIALWCIQMKAINRPTMSRVIEMLQSEAASLEMPPRPFMEVSLQEFPVRPSEVESCHIELSLISKEASML